MALYIDGGCQARIYTLLHYLFEKILQCTRVNLISDKRYKYLSACMKQ